MIFDLAAGDKPVSDVAVDTCVIGSGAAGITLAADLVRRGQRVTLIEAGGRRHERMSGVLAQGEVVGHPHIGMNAARFRVLGGTTTEWGGQILELDALDFEERPWVAGSGWPFPKEELARHYRKALQVVGLAEAPSDRDVWRGLNLAPPHFGEDIEPILSRWCPERNFARLEAKLLAEHERLSVFLHANACGMILDESGQRLAGIRCRSLNGREAVFRAERFALCLGGIETARFLLQAERDGQGPWNPAGLVGTNFMDHLVCSGGVLSDFNGRIGPAHFEYLTWCNLKYHLKLKLSARAQSELETLAVGATVDFQDPDHETQERAADLATRLRQRRLGLVNLPDAALLARHLSRRVLSRAVRRTSPRRRPGSRAVLRVHTEQAPRNASRISLSADRDMLGMFRARLDWQPSSIEHDTVRKFVRVIETSFHSLQIGTFQPHPDLYASDSRFIATFQDSAHHIGGTPMSDDPRYGIVDANLKFHSLTNAYICSSSVFPTGGFSNPTHTIIALALRLSEHLEAMRSRARKPEVGRVESAACVQVAGSD